MVAENFGEACPASAPFFGYMGAAAALIFASEFVLFFLLSLHMFDSERACCVTKSVKRLFCLVGFDITLKCLGNGGGAERSSFPP